jgi:hypothetical protein
MNVIHPETGEVGKLKEVLKASPEHTLYRVQYGNTTIAYYEADYEKLLKIDTVPPMTVSIGDDNEKKASPFDLEMSALSDFFDSTDNTEDIVKPERYNKGSIEVWDFILDQNLGFLEGNIIKYICRSSMKGGIDDLKKARVYLDKLISQLEK